MAVTSAKFTGALDVERGIINFAANDLVGTANTNLDYILESTFAHAGTTALAAYTLTASLVAGTAQLTGAISTTTGAGAGIVTGGTIRVDRSGTGTALATSVLYTIRGY